MAAGSLTAQAVADLVGGRLLGDGDLVLRAVGPLDRAGPDALSLAASPRFAAELRATNAGAVLVPEALAGVPGGARARIVVPEPYAALAAAIAALYPAPRPATGIDPTARLGPGVVLGAEVSVGPHAVLGRDVRVGSRSRLGPGVTLGDGVTVGDDCVLGPRVVCYAGARIGSRVVIKAGAVVGGDGFGYRRDGSRHVRLPHVGGCVIEDEVEIGSNSCIDRGSIDDTVIGRGTKIDNLVQVGHNCRIGERCLVMAGAGLAGSVRIGDDVIVAGMAGLADHVEIGAGARVAAKSGVFGDVPAGTTVSGYPARPHRQFLRAQAALYRLAPVAEALERAAAAEARRA